MTDKEKNKYFRDFILWKQEGLDIEKHHCLFINFGVNMMFEYPQIRNIIIIFLYKCISFKWIQWYFKQLELKYFDIQCCSVSLQYDIKNLVDPFAHTEHDWEKILQFDFIEGNSTAEKEKIKIDETFCTLITVGGKFLEKKAFRMVMKKIDEIRKIIRA